MAYEIPHQQRVLEAIRLGRNTRPQMQCWCGLKPSQVHTAVQALKRKGLVEVAERDCPNPFKHGNRVTRFKIVQGSQADV